MGKLCPYLKLQIHFMALGDSYYETSTLKVVRQL